MNNSMRLAIGLFVALAAPVSAQPRVTASSSLLEAVPMNEWHALVLDRADEDIGGFAATPETFPTRITVPPGMGGLYSVEALTTAWQSASPFYLLWIRKNGTTPLGEDVRTGQAVGIISLHASWSGVLLPGDFVELVFWHWHDVAVAPADPVYVGDTTALRATRVTLRRLGDAPVSVIALSGQSNALKLRPYLADALRASGKNLVGWQKGAQQISVWDEGQPGWIGLAPTLTSQVKALVWWQGESDGENGISAGYQSRLAAFMARVRTAVGNPILPVFVIEVGSHPLFAEIRPQQAAYCAGDPYCTFISASMMPAYVSHMDAAGYTSVATLLASLLP